MIIHSLWFGVPGQMPKVTEYLVIATQKPIRILAPVTAMGNGPEKSKLNVGVWSAIMHAILMIEMDDTLVQEPSCKTRTLDLWTDDPFREFYTAWILFLVVSL